MSNLRVWLRQHGLESCAETLAENEVDFDVLPELREADLEKIGLALGPRKKLLKAIRELDRSRLGGSAESLIHRSVSFEDADASNAGFDHDSYVDHHHATTVRPARAGRRALSRVLIIACACAAIALGWVYYHKSQQYARAEEAYINLMNLAEASSVEHRFDEAEKYYARAYELAEQLDRSHKQDLLNAKTASYTKLLITPYRDALYSIRGTVWTRVDDPVKCVGGREACGYHFKPDDHGRIFGSRADITITTDAGQRLPLRDGMRLSEIFPAGGDICCSYTRKAAVPRLSFSVSGSNSANVYVSRK